MSILDIPSLGNESVLHIKPFRGVNIDWIIGDYSKLPKQEDSYLDSPLYTLHNSQCSIRLFPFRDHHGKDRLFLMKKNSPSECNIAYNVGYKSSNGSVVKAISGSKIFPKEESSMCLNFNLPYINLCGLTLFLTAHFLGSDAADAATLNAAGAATLNAASPSNDDAEETLSDKFTKLFLSGSASDVTFNVAGKEFKAHRSVLAAWSPVFKAMFEADMEKNKDIISIINTHPSVFYDFLLFLYSGKPDAVSAKNCMGLYVLAQKYLIKELKEACVDCIKEEMSVHSVCCIFHFGQKKHVKKLPKAAREFFIENFSLISLTPQWQAFRAEHSGLAKFLFGRRVKYIQELKQSNVSKKK